MLADVTTAIQSGSFISSLNDAYTVAGVTAPTFIVSPNITVSEPVIAYPPTAMPTPLPSIQPTAAPSDTLFIVQSDNDDGGVLLGISLIYVVLVCVVLALSILIFVAYQYMKIRDAQVAPTLKNLVEGTNPLSRGSGKVGAIVTAN